MLHTQEELSNKKQMATTLHKQFTHPTPERLKSLTTTAGKQDKELFKEIDMSEKLGVHVITTGAEFPRSNGLVE